MSPLHIDRISLQSFNEVLSRYPDAAPSTLKELDTLRYQAVPEKLAKNTKDAHLLKSDVEKLVEWKLKHGTFRPSLMNLVKSNPADLVKSTTQDGFATYAKTKDAMAALKILTKLRGIGPATASLLLNVHSPGEVPFFSDELFRWTHWDVPAKAQGGWQRSIKYNVTEYKEVLASVEELRARLGVSAVDTEKVAYVLGNENADLDQELRTEGDVGQVVQEKAHESKDKDIEVRDEKDGAEARMAEIRKAVKEEKERGVKKEAHGKKAGDVKEERAAIDDATESTTKKGTKRKAQEKAPAEGARRSSRRKA